ncbi:MAG: copper resistance protein NlpE N-terminal domain-containing protein [Balneolaceae bacterium]
MNLDKKTAIIIVIALIGFISFRLYIVFNAPSTAPVNQDRDQDQISTESFPVDLPAVYTGTLPCASCPGIDTHLLIREDSFREVSWYREEDDGPFTETGTWAVRSDTLILENEDRDVYKQFLLEENRLRMLSRDGSEVTGELSDNYLLDFSQTEQSIRSNHRDLQNEGVTFVAAGNEPFWSFRIYGSDSLSYITPDTKLQGSIIDKTDTIISAEFESGSQATLELSEDYCRDSMSGFLFTHSVEVQIGEDSLSGCGRMLVD